MLRAVARGMPSTLLRLSRAGEGTLPRSARLSFALRDEELGTLFELT